MACALSGCGTETEDPVTDQGPTLNDLLERINQKYEETFYGYEVRSAKKTSQKNEVRFELPEITMSTVDAKPQTFRVSVAFLYQEKMELKQELSGRRSQITGLVKTLLENRHASEIDSPEGIKKIQEEIKSHVNLILKKGRMKSVIIKRPGIRK